MRTKRHLSSLIAAGVAFLLVPHGTSFAAAANRPAFHIEPAHKPLLVAFVISDGAQTIDITGPWEVFDDASVGDQKAFKLITVAASRKPVTLTGGLTVVPDATFDDLPQPDIVVVGAQGGLPSPAAKVWLRTMHEKAQIEMSVCIGALWLAEAGLLDGKRATTHHDAFAAFSKRYPKIELVYARYVQSDEKVLTSGGLTSGIDLALHIVDLYFGRETAAQTAAFMEYEGSDWK